MKITRNTLRKMILQEMRQTRRRLNEGELEGFLEKPAGPKYLKMLKDMATNTPGGDPGSFIRHIADGLREVADEIDADAAAAGSMSPDELDGVSALTVYLSDAPV